MNCELFSYGAKQTPVKFLKKATVCLQVIAGLAKLVQKQALLHQAKTLVQIGELHTVTVVTANSEKPAGFGLPLLCQMIQAAHGA